MKYDGFSYLKWLDTWLMFFSPQCGIIIVVIFFPIFL